jgi:integrase
LAHIEVELERGLVVDPRLARTTLREWSERYMTTTVHLRPKTRAAYPSLLRTTILPSLGDKQVGRLRPIDVQEWVASMHARGLSASRIRQGYRLLSQMMAAAEDSGLTARTPCRRIRLPRMEEHEPNILTREQVAALAAACRPPYDLLVEVLAYSGLRIGEALALRRESVDLLGGRLIVRESLSEANGQITFQTPKNHQQRAVTVPAFLLRRLREHLDANLAADPRALLFVGATGEPMRHAGVMRRAWLPAVAASGLVGVTPHDLRATHASWVIDEGGSVMDAAARLGHAAGTVTTRHYARPVLGRDAEIAERLNRWADSRHSTAVRSAAGPDRDRRTVPLVR